VQALLAVDGGGSVVGLAHYRTFARPLTATNGGQRILVLTGRSVAPTAAVPDGPIADLARGVAHDA